MKEDREQVVLERIGGASLGRWLQRLTPSSRVLVQCVTGLSLTFLLALIGLLLHLNLSTASLIYLMLVVSFSLYCGFWQASLVSLAAILCETYFFAPPAYSWYISDPRNAVAIVIFELTALVVSRVSAREKIYARETRVQREQLQRLFEISRGVLLLDLADSPERQMSELILHSFELQAVAILNEVLGSSGAGGAWALLDGDMDIARILGLSPEAQSLRPKGLLEVPLYAGTNRIGLLLVLGDLTPMTMEPLGSLVSLTLERHGAFVKQSAAEAARQTEQLRSTVLDGLAHAFKTPLTIIRAASSGLLDAGHLDETQTELTRMIDEQSDHLNTLTTRLLQTARVHSDDLCLQLERVNVSELLEEVISNFRYESDAAVNDTVTSSTIHVKVPEVLPSITADYEMLRSTLSELLDNAIKYSEQGAPVTLAAQSDEREMLLSVHSWGKVIQLEDRERIFERFYRSREHRHSAPGTGIGLSVARRATEAHNGHIWVTSSEAEGTTFYVSLPQGEHGQQNNFPKAYSIKGENKLGNKNIDRR